MRRGIARSAFVLGVAVAAMCRAGNYRNFTVSTYVMQSTVNDLMAGRLDAADSLAFIQPRLHLDEIYLEVMRNRTLVDEAGLDKLKKVYQDQGLTVCGGLAYSVSESNGYQGFDYADPKDRAFVQQAAEMAARHFDEILLDDYFFFDRKTDYDIKAKGDRTWSQFRLDTMRDAAENLVIKPAHAVNPKCKVIIKFANWYDQYHGMGNDTEKVPYLADGMYCGTESRTWVGQEQRMLPYQSYDILRFMDNLKPGVAKGGWVDLGGSNPIDRYPEELWDTVFAKRPEITCFEYTAMLSGIRPRSTQDRAWDKEPTGFNFDALTKDLTDKASAEVAKNPGYAGVAGFSLRQADAFLDKLGTPVGVKSYTPYHANGEDFLHDYFGMIGVPMDVYPYFPDDAPLVLLTEQAAADAKIVDKIKTHLTAGKSVAITSGLLKALKGKGIEDVCENEVTGNTVAINAFASAGGPGAPNRGGMQGQHTPHDVLIPEIHYWNILTHDAWGELLGISPAGTTYPMVLSCAYGRGTLYVITVPNDPAELFTLPTPALDVLRSVLTQNEPVRLEDAPAQVALFRYDNDAAIVQNFLPTAVTVTVSMPAGTAGLSDLLHGGPVGTAVEPVRRRPTTSPASPGGYDGMKPRPMPPTTGPATPPRVRFTLAIPPHSYLPVAPVRK